jgi:hypothetical protein
MAERKPAGARSVGSLLEKSSVLASALTAALHNVDEAQQQTPSRLEKFSAFASANGSHTAPRPHRWKFSKVGAIVISCINDNRALTFWEFLSARARESWWKCSKVCFVWHLVCELRIALTVVEFRQEASGEAEDVFSDDLTSLSEILGGSGISEKRLAPEAVGMRKSTVHEFRQLREKRSSIFKGAIRVVKTSARTSSASAAAASSNIRESIYTRTTAPAAAAAAAAATSVAGAPAGALVAAGKAQVEVIL